jgi:hypothetical protein
MTLTVALALLAAGVLALLALQAWWVGRRLRPRRQTLEEAVSSRFEPALEGAGLGDEAPGPRSFADTRPQELADEAVAAVARLASRRSVPRLDALIDTLVPLRLDAPISGELALAHLPPTRRAGGKPFYIEGLDADTGEWEPPAPGQRYSELQAGVQMANRGGPLNEIEYSEFVQKVQAYAESVGANPEFPDMLDEVARARELDGLASPLDAQLNITLRSNGVAWSAAFVQQLAARHGFLASAAPGRMLLPAAEPGSPPLLALAVDGQAALAEEPQATAVRECVLTLDVPQIDEALEPFPMFYRVVNELATGLDATAVDNEGVPLSLQAFATIGRELDELYKQLRALDLAAGSAAARRLFS